MASRYYPQKDINTFDKFNKEVVGDLVAEKDGIIYPSLDPSIFEIKFLNTDIKGNIKQY